MTNQNADQNTDQNIVRPYGPGKFDTLLDAYVYEVSLGGCCDEEIDSETGCGTYYALMRGGRSIFRDHDPDLETLNECEKELLTGCAGVILSEDSNGFVYAKYYDTEEQLDAEWCEIQENFPTVDEDSETEDNTEDN